MNNDVEITPTKVLLEQDVTPINGSFASHPVCWVLGFSQCVHFQDCANLKLHMIWGVQQAYCMLIILTLHAICNAHAIHICIVTLP